MRLSAGMPLAHSRGMAARYHFHASQASDCRRAGRGHGAKSEPGNTTGLRRFIDRRVDAVREQWKAGMRLVTEAPEGAHLAVVQATSTDPNAGTYEVSPHQRSDRSGDG
jgi:hypothetical protein